MDVILLVALLAIVGLAAVTLAGRDVLRKLWSWGKKTMRGEDPVS